MAWSDFFLPSGAMTAQEQQDNYARQQAEYQRRVDRGLTTGAMTPEEAADALNTSSMSGLENQDSAAWEGAKEGAAEGLGNVLDFPGQVVGKVGEGASRGLWGVVKNVPWWVWAIGAAVLFVQLGGLTMARAVVKKKAAAI